MTLVVRVKFYNGVAAVRNRDADFKKLKQKNKLKKKVKTKK